MSSGCPTVRARKCRQWWHKFAGLPTESEPAGADRALQAIKDPYVFDFRELTEDARERHLEQALIDDIQSFMWSPPSSAQDGGGEHRRSCYGPIAD
jgi:hypothetical protein